MDFYAMLDQVVEILRHRGRVTYRALKLQFHLDDHTLEALSEELLYAHPQVQEDAGKGLVWAAGAASAAAPGAGRAEPPVPPTSAGTAWPAPQPPAPHTYTPPHLVEKILTSHAALEGERKQVTVLFCDLANSTGLAEQLGPEKMHTVLNQFFAHALEAVHRYEGTINQFLGDGFMALFGAPLAHEDHAHRAVLAALELRHRLQASNASQVQGITLTIRIGLNTGLVVVGAIGDNLRMDYTAVGDTTNVAARLEHEAAPDQIVISEATYRLVAGYCTTRALGAFSLRGKAEPVRVWEILDALAARTRLDVAAERGLTPFVGREHELHTLQECFAHAQAGHGQVVFLVGEAGLGKSRVLVEFRRRLAGESCTWLRGRCLSYGRGMVYHPIIDLLHQYFQVEEGDDDSTIIAKIDQGMAVLGADLQPAIPHVRSLLSVPAGDDAVLSMDAQQRRFKLFEALRALILRWSETRPLVLVVEDLHWSDPTTEETLRYLADSVATARVVLLMTYRPGYHNPFGERTYISRLVLHALSAHESAQLAESMLATSALPIELRDVIMHKAEGNPFFIEEVLTSLLETGALAQEDGRYLLRTSLPDIDVPDTIQGVIMARIDRLADAPRRALQLASVVGREFTLRLVARIADVEAPLEPAFQELKVLEFIYERSIHPELAYMFKHALTHEVAYNSLLVQRQKGLHHMVAMAIEELYAERLPEFYAMLAYHYEQGEVWGKTLGYLVQAGQKAQQAYANQEAVGYYDRALAVSAQLETVEPSTLLTLYAGKGAAHFLLSAFAPAIEAYRHMREVAQQVGDRTQEALALYQLGMCCLWAHDFEQTLDYAAQARAIAETIDAKASLAGSLWVSGKIPMVTGDLDTARSAFATSLRLSREAGDKTLEGFSLWDLGLLCNWQGEYERGLQLQEQAITLGQAHHLGLVLLWAIWMKGLTCGGKGAYDEAVVALQEAKTLSEQLGDTFFRCRTLNTLGWLYGELYNLDQALHYNREAAEASQRIGEPELIRYAEINLANNYLVLGDLERAQHYLAQIDQAMQQPGTWGDEWMKWRYEQYLYHSLGELWLTKGSAGQALEYAEACLKLAEPSTSRKNLVKGWRLKGQALLVQGHGEQAAEALSCALRMAREIGNPPQLWKTWEALGTLYEWQRDRAQARTAYRSAWEVIQGVAERLRDQDLKRTFLGAPPIQQVQSRLARVEGR